MPDVDRSGKSACLTIHAGLGKNFLQTKSCGRRANPNIRLKRCLPCDQQRPRIGEARGLDVGDVFFKMFDELFDPGAHGDVL